MRNLFKLVFQRTVIVSFCILLELLALFCLLFVLGSFGKWLALAMFIAGYVYLFVILNSNTDASYKMAWIIPILAFPVFGVFLYLLFGGNRLSRRLRQAEQEFDQAMCSYLPQEESAEAALAARDPDALNQSRYIYNMANCPVRQNTETRYFALGDDCFPVMLEELEQAERYIFLEYFIIEPGQMWDAILDVLTRKAAAGVDVRVIYDDFGCIRTLPYHYRRELEQRGIRCAVFNPYVPVMSSRLNNRDHRKFMIIDGLTAFTGGINLADEYINRRIRFGHWKDCALLLRGEAVYSMTVAFLSMWNNLRPTDHSYTPFRPAYPDTDGTGFVQPYVDTPLDDEPVGRNVYINLISKANRYVYIATPYLIPDDATIAALTNAAKSGVDVRIVTPHVPDKKYAFLLTRSYYEILISAGVRIYEYKPGFVHSKLFCVDGELATVGSINLDYRSLYLHFENGVWLYRTQCIEDIRYDFSAMFDAGIEITLEECLKVPWPLRILRAVLRAFAPLM